MELPAIDIKSVDSFSNSTRSDDLSVYVKPMLNADETRKHFGIDLIGGKTLAVLVRVQNHSAGRSYVLAGENVQLRRAENVSQLGAVTTLNERDTGGEGVAMVGALVISMPLMFVGGKMISHSTVTKHALVTKRVYKTTVSPGQSRQGFVYFQIPDKNIPFSKDKWRLIVTLPQIGSEKRKILILQIQ